MAATRECREQARQILDLLPVLRRWTTGRVQAAGADLGISARQYAALRGIREGATSPGELARLWQVTPAVITGIVDRLEQRELVRREPDPGDRRRLRLALTATGLAASEDIERALVDDLAAHLAIASPAALGELGRALDLLRRTFAALEAGTRATPQGPDDEDLPAWLRDDETAPTDAEGRPLVATGRWSREPGTSPPEERGSAPSAREGAWMTDDAPRIAGDRFTARARHDAGREQVAGLRMDREPDHSDMREEYQAR